MGTTVVEGVGLLVDGVEDKVEGLVVVVGVVWTSLVVVGVSITAK
mgnify:CR=1 FL=1